VGWRQRRPPAEVLVLQGARVSMMRDHQRHDVDPFGGLVNGAGTPVGSVQCAVALLLLSGEGQFIEWMACVFWGETSRRNAVALSPTLLLLFLCEDRWLNGSKTFCLSTHRRKGARPAGAPEFKQDGRRAHDIGPPNSAVHCVLFCPCLNGALLQAGDASWEKTS